MIASTKLIDIESFLQEMTAFEQHGSNVTFLSIGGRGYYENPTSDLLRFFFQPSNAHELNTIFINAFLEAAGFQGNLNIDQKLLVTREVETKDRKRIDLVISSPQWLLMIENKIWHDQVNPFEQYEQLAAEIAGVREIYWGLPKTRFLSFGFQIA